MLNSGNFNRLKRCHVRGYNVFAFLAPYRIILLADRGAQVIK